MHVPKILAGIVAFVGIGLFQPTAARAHDKHERQDRLEGRAYDRMRELAHVLDERAQHAADQAADTAHHGGRDERRFLDTVFHFARQTADFHRRMDRYRESPWDVPGEVDHLVRDARQVNRRIHDAHVFEHTWDDWDAVLNVLDQMQRVNERFDDRDSHRFRD
jgi:hypothetical protein